MQAPVCTSAWAYRKMETFATSPAAPRMGFLLARSVYLWDPPIVEASQPGLPRVLLFAAALTSTSQLQPGLPNQLFPEPHEQKTSPGRAVSPSCCISARQVRLRHVSAALPCLSSTRVVDASSASAYRAISLAAFLSTKFTF